MVHSVMSLNVPEKKSYPKKKVPVSAYNFFFLNMFYTHKHSNNAITHILFNYMYQKLSLLHW